jgi:hypothetical protein
MTSPAPDSSDEILGVLESFKLPEAALPPR